MTQNSVCRQEVIVNLPDGLHLRPLSRIAEIVRESQSDVCIRNGQIVVDAANVLELMTLNADFGTKLLLEASGDDAAAVIEQLVGLFESNFDAGESSTT